MFLHPMLLLLDRKSPKVVLESLTSEYRSKAWKEEEKGARPLEVTSVNARTFMREAARARAFHALGIDAKAEKEGLKKR